jgi:hypothetical protein
VHGVEEIVSTGARGELLIGSTGSTGGRHHAIVSDLDGLDLPGLDALGEVVQRNWLNVGSPTLLYDREEERDDRDQDDQIDEAVSQPFSIHAWWDPPGCWHYTRGATASQVFRG